jgi:hypothetical protein
MTNPLTKELLSTARVIARGRGIRDLDRLLSTYGGTASSWVKKSTRPVRGSVGWLEYHWYEHHGIGRFEIKVVDLRDRLS